MKKLKIIVISIRSIQKGRFFEFINRKAIEMRFLGLIRF